MRRIAVTGAAGQIAYSLVFRLANGELYGKQTPISLALLETPEVLGALEGVRMELEDGAYPLLREIRIGSDPYDLFREVDVALLIGAKPRGPGMERRDLLLDNAAIFVEQGKALNAVASREVKVLVVGNPCNTNCLIALHHAPDLSKACFHAMTRLDQHRAVAQLAKRADVPMASVQCVTIWGNHSSTQVPDLYHALISGHPAIERIGDTKWAEEEFVPAVQGRGGRVLEARGKSSAASAAEAILRAAQALLVPTPEGEWYSSGVWSSGNPYGIRGELVFSFPCQTKESGGWEIVPALEWNPWLRAQIARTERELLEERDLVKTLLSS